MTDDYTLSLDEALKLQSESLRNMARYFEDHPELGRHDIIAALKQAAELGPDVARAMIAAVAKAVDKRGS
jgi:hypothetical protein